MTPGRMIRRACCVVAAATALWMVLQTATAPSLAEPPRLSLEDRVMEIADELMCPVCRGQSVAESNSELAVEMREIIRRKLTEGESKEEIIAYFVDRYGDSILGAPPPRGKNLLLWLLPGAAIVAGGVAVGLIVRKNRNGMSDTEEAAPGATSRQSEADEDALYAARLEQELERYDA